jgi:hypothetical protein
MIYRVFLSAIGLMVLLLSSLSAGERIGLSAHLDKSDIAFEETVELQLEIRWNGNITSYAFEVLPLPELENLKVLGTSSSISSGIENGQETTTRFFKYRLKPTSSGVGTVNPIILQCVSMPDSIPNQLATQLLTVNIAKPIPVEEKSGIPAYLIVFLVIILIAGFTFVVLRMRKKPEAIPNKSPEEIFFEDLTRLKQDGQSDRKIFFTRLYKMLTSYIEKKYGLEVLNQTAENIVAKLENIEMPINDRDKISNWLIKSEKEKYAPFGGEPGDIIRLTAELEKYFEKRDINDKSEEK